MGFSSATERESERGVMNKKRVLAAAMLVALFPAAGFAQNGPDVIVGALTGPSTWGGNGITYAISIGTRRPTTRL